MNTRLGPVLSARELPLAELSSARLDGEVFPLAESWFAIDEIDAPQTRALAAGALVPARAIAERATAAWIYGLVPEPFRHEFCADPGARVHVGPSPRLRLREVRFSPADSCTIGGLRVTTPLRTAVDLARCTRHDSPELTALLAALLRYGGFGDVAPARSLCQCTATPNRKGALTRLDRAQVLLGPG